MRCRCSISRSRRRGASFRRARTSSRALGSTLRPLGVPRTRASFPDCCSFLGPEDARSFISPFYNRGSSKGLTRINNSAARNPAGVPLRRLAPAFCGRLVARAELFHAVLGVGLRLARSLHHLHQRLEIVAREQVRPFALDVHADRLGLALRAGDDLRERLARAVEHSQRPQRARERLGIHRLLVGWTVRHVQPPRFDTRPALRNVTDARRCRPKVKRRRRGKAAGLKLLRKLAWLGGLSLKGSCWHSKHEGIAAPRDGKRKGGRKAAFFRYCVRRLIPPSRISLAQSSSSS